MDARGNAVLVRCGSFTRTIHSVILRQSVPSRPRSVDTAWNAVAAVSAIRQFSCGSLVYGLDAEDCEYMVSIGMYAQGENAMASDYENGIWIGTDGPNTFTFVNATHVPMTLIMWHRAPRMTRRLS